MSRCPSWCVADHTRDPAHTVLHRGTTHTVPVVIEGRGADGPHDAELLIEMSRRHGEIAVWVYLGDGWTGFSLSLESARRVSASLVAALREAEGAARAHDSST